MGSYGTDGHLDIDTLTTNLYVNNIAVTSGDIA